MEFKMKLKHVLFLPLIFLTVLYLFFPQTLPRQYNSDIKKMETEIFMTPVGLQENTSALHLCETYKYDFVASQIIAIKSKIKVKEFLLDLKKDLPLLPTSNTSFESIISQGREESILEAKKKLEFYNETLKYIEKKYILSYFIFC
jgi:hypothetical protein